MKWVHAFETQRIMEDVRKHLFTLDKEAMTDQGNGSTPVQLYEQMSLLVLLIGI